MPRQLLFYALAAFASSVPRASAEASVDYLRDIKPVLAERCYACHGALKQKAGLRLDTAERIHRGGIEGEVLSKLLGRITNADPDERMPPEGKPLADGTVATIRDWLAVGAPIPDGEKGDDDPRDHWAFQRIEQPPGPLAGPVNAIDVFFAKKRTAQGLKPQPRADRSLLIRRLYLGLIGLPPTADQLRDPRSWVDIVDELLASPHHGEHWGRHWMDVWRYSDWYGLNKQLRDSQRHIWRWRDWIVESLNADKGYDRMVLEMLAGDELAPGDPDVVRATGFLARNYYLFNRTTWLDNTIEHTGKALLGLTLNCAKCHDHKYDPLTHLDYYRFRAIFEPHQVRLDPVPGETDFDKDGLPRVFDGHLDAVTYLHLRGDPKDPDKDTKIEPGVPAILASFAPQIEPVELPYVAYAPGAREHVQDDRLKQARAELAKADEALAKAQAKALAKESVKRSPPGTADSGFAVADEFDAPDDTLWEIAGDDWAYRDGALHKTTANRENNVVVLREKPPRDFELTARYTTTGGTTYKSVGFRFDRSGDGKNQHQVYTSAHEPDPKVQVSHTVNGKDQYPPSGKVSKPIKVGQSCELKFAVRDRLLNVWLNGELVLAFNLPNRGSDGSIAFSAFDATAAFDSISVRALPPEVELKEAVNKTTDGGGLAETEATQHLRAMELQSLEAIVAADRARANGSDAFARLAAEAARSEAKVEITKARFDLVKAGGHAAKRKAAQERAAKAEEKLAGVVEGEATYRPIRASRKALETPAHKFDSYPAVYPKTSTGRRLALAKWVVHRDNPLTARVAVNHVWMRHFGEPLVETVADFGRRAKRPEHAELLDYLAVEFIESGWSFRHLHRLIVTSNAYQLSSSNAAADPMTSAADPNNRFYWRMNPRRMESQVVRDSLLHLAGVLDTTLGGPSIDPKNGGMRRGLYFMHSRDQKDKFLAMFDNADHLQCYRRSKSIVPQQALALSNSKLALDMAEKISARTSGEGDAFVVAAFETILGHAPDEAEIEACREFQGELAKLPGGEHRIRARVIHALLNHNDFVTIR